jgi:UDP-glucose 4-epimerase
METHSDFYLGKSVLVTGGAGFIGSYLVRALLENGANVTITTRNSTDLWRLNDVIKKIKIENLNLQSKEQVFALIEKVKPNIVFNLMSDIDVRRDISLVEHMVKNNFISTLNLITALVNRDFLEYFINTGTCEEYGDGKTPFLESQKEIPVSPYSLSKVFSTHLAGYMGKIQKFPIVNVRPFLTYGPKQINKQFIPYIISSLLKDKELNLTKMEQTRDFIYVDDVVSGMLKIPLSKIQNGETINLGSGEETILREVVEIICKKLEKDFDKYVKCTLPYREGETMHFYSSIKKAEALLGWKPKISLEEGLEKTINWFKSHSSN